MMDCSYVFVHLDLKKMSIQTCNRRQQPDVIIVDISMAAAETKLYQ